LMEGFICNPTVNPQCLDTAGLLRPVWDYPNAGPDISITGGYVYRGSAVPSLAGKYIYADFGSGKTWALTYDGIHPPTNQLLTDEAFLISSFGVDEQNELYLLEYSSTNGRIRKLTGPPKRRRGKSSAEGVRPRSELSQSLQSINNNHVPTSQLQLRFAQSVRRVGTRSASAGERGSAGGKPSGDVRRERLDERCVPLSVGHFRRLQPDAQDGLDAIIAPYEHNESKKSSRRSARWGDQYSLMFGGACRALSRTSY